MVVAVVVEILVVGSIDGRVHRRCSDNSSCSGGGSGSSNSIVACNSSTSLML